MASQNFRDYLTRVAVLAVVVSIIHIDPTVSIKGGAPGNKCDFPGLTVVLNDKNAVLCTGVRVSDVIILPLKCRFIILGAVMMEGLVIKNSGFQWVYPQGTTITGETRMDGTYQMTLAGAAPVPDSDETVGESCFTSSTEAGDFMKLFEDGFNGVLYDGSETLDFSTCQLVGYGSAINDGVDYSAANLRVTSVTKSTSAPCCAAITDTITTEEQGIGVLSMDYPFNCITVAGAPCGLGDLGAPVMCTTSTGKKVTIGLVASSPCIDNGLFLIHDLTGNSEKTKFGLTAA